MAAIIEMPDKNIKKTALLKDSAAPVSSKSERDRKKRNERILFAGLAAVILIFFAFNYLTSRKNAVLVEVSVDGQILETYRLNETVNTVIESSRGGTNHLIIQDGGVSISEASCPDKVCVHQGVIRETGQSLVCLPNKVIVTIK